MTYNIKDLYQNDVRKALQEKFAYNNTNQVPRIEKVVVNMGLGEAVSDSKMIEGAVEEMSLITGQKPVITKAKKSIAGFKLREGMPIGCKVTLRQQKMYDFLDRLVYIALPRVRDFRGLSAKSFDGNGNYSLGLKEQIVFPEINYDKIQSIRGLDIVIVTSATNDNEAKALLQGINMPFYN